MKLEGLKVLDLSQFLPGPHLTMTMADHGADVIMIEPANGVGEPSRELGARTADGTAVWFRNVARGKRSLKLDLKNAEGRALFHALAKEADVVVEAFRPGVAKRLGADYDTLAALNPRLVYCAISAFGQDGPLRDRPAHDLTVQGLAGTIALGLGLEDGKPAAPNMPSADVTASLSALSAILMALLRREKTGRGDYIDISMFDTLLAWTPNVTGPVFARGRAPEPKAMRSFGGQAMNRIYETSDGQFVLLGGSEVKFAENLLRALGRLDLLDYAKLEPGPGQKPLVDFFIATFAAKTRAEWEAFLAPIDCCWAPVRTLKDGFDDPHTAHRAMRLTDADGNTHIGTALKFRNEPGAPDLSLPGYGEHSEAIAREAGMDPAALRAAKAI
jgi:crotonobetainyl-CoA:carnitine CoA-transferase CaiB-like acyl-CoA transferase